MTFSQEARGEGMPRPPAVEPPVLHASVSPHILRRGLQHGGSDLGFARLFQLLQAGKPVRILAFGTSVTGVAGGCTHSLLPYCDSCCGTRQYGPKAARREQGGFLRLAFDWINGTWPHADNRLYNGGRPGAGGLGNFVGCLSSWIPEDIDLFLLEVGGTGSTNAAIERLARDIYHLRPRTQMPALAIYDMWNFRWKGSLPSAKSSRPGRANAAYASGSAAALPPPSSGFGSVPYAGAMGRYYGWPVVSEHDSLYHEFLQGRHGLTTPRSRPRRAQGAVKPPWQQLKPDLVHPTVEASAIYGDLISLMLYQAYELWRVLGPHSRQTLETALLKTRLPPPLVVPASEDGDVTLACFTFDEARLSGDPQLNAPDSHMIDAEGGLAPHILTNNGWRYVRRVAASARANKPGLLATSASAVLELRVLPLERNIAGKAVAKGTGASASTAAWVDTVTRARARASASNARSLPGVRDIWLAMRHLVSYERQGRALVSCTGGCLCNAHTIDAHRPSPRESVEIVHEFRARVTVESHSINATAEASEEAGGVRDVGGGGSCVLRVEVLSETSSSGHEFKLTRLVVNALGASTRRKTKLGLPS